jgi:UDP-N-acetylmuramate--alanine ligase
VRPPAETGPIHFIGAGGIGMSGIAEILTRQGYRVTGSDASDGYTLKALRALGAAIHAGHDAGHVKGAAAVVVSSAIKAGNPELEAARAAHIPIVHRADMLAELMRPLSSVAVAGTHGKTTTTTMAAAVMEAGGLDPTVVNGGVINAYGSNAKLGKGGWILVEADESDGSFTRLPLTAAVVTNADPEHLDHYKSYDDIKRAFRDFLSNVPFYGFGVVCADHEALSAIAASIADRRMVAYGFAESAAVRGMNARAQGQGWAFDVQFSAATRGGKRVAAGFTLPMPGLHNVSNALAAIALGAELGVSDDALRAAMAGFEGVQRRFTRVGEWNGAAIIDDYSHNPPKIAAAIEAARQVAAGKVIAVMQPHRFTRLSGLFDEFASCMLGADVAIVSPVYPAGEAPIAGADRDSLLAAMRAKGQKQALALNDPAELPGMIRSLAKPGDVVIVMGAGTNTAWAKALPGDLAKMDCAS